MSRGAGRVERAIKAALEAAGENAVLNVADLCAKVYGIETSKVDKRHRVAVLRALDNQSWRGWRLDTSFRPARIHHSSNPQRIWAVQITPDSVLWAEAALTGLTKTKVRVRYRGELALLDRRSLARWDVAYWRGLAFTSKRRGSVASEFDQQWRDQYARPGEPAPMPIDEACALLKIGRDYTRESVLTAFRREVKKVHPDLGGTSEQFRALFAARERLLATLGTSAPAPREPDYAAPKGVKVIYYSVSARADQRRLKGDKHLLQ
jgi:hypothetical protein